MRQVSKIVRGLSYILLSGCASLAEDPNKVDLAQSLAADVATKPAAIIATSSSHGLAEYKAQDSSTQVERAEWIACKQTSPAKATMLVMHGDKAGFDKSKFCSGWIAQAFLSQGLDVLTVNRPGFAGSVGPADFVGPASLAAIEAGVNAGLKQAQLSAPIGIWGYSSGATAAAFASKKIKGLKFALLGGGIYDLEEVNTNTKDPYLKAELKMIKESGGDDALAERTLSYDVSDLPTNIIIYHGASDTSASLAQASAFNDSLASSQYKVSLQKLDALGHNIPWIQHRKIVETLVAQAQK